MQALAEIEPLKSLKLQDEVNERVESVEGKMLAHPMAKLAKDYHVEHRFSDGVYVRQILMPRGDTVIGAKHRTRHLNIIQQGRAAVIMDGELQIIQAPMIFESAPGVRKVLHILDGPMIWATVHVTTERDLDKLQEQLIEHSQTFLEYENDRRILMESVGGL